MNANPFIWLGGERPGFGVLHLDRSDGSRIVVHPKGEPIDMDRPEAGEYSGVVRKPENLNAPGLAATVDFWVKAGKARYITIVDRSLDALDSVPDASDQQTENDRAVTESVEAGNQALKNSQVAQNAALKKQTAALAAQITTVVQASAPVEVAADYDTEGAGPIPAAKNGGTR